MASVAWKHTNNLNNAVFVFDFPCRLPVQFGHVFCMEIQTSCHIFFKRQEDLPMWHNLQTFLKKCMSWIFCYTFCIFRYLRLYATIPRREYETQNYFVFCGKICVLVFGYTIWKKQTWGPRGNCTPIQKLACFVLYLKNYQHLFENIICILCSISKLSSPFWKMIYAFL